jgi:hypothetical protein
MVILVPESISAGTWTPFISTIAVVAFGSILSAVFG